MRYRLAGDELTEEQYRDLPASQLEDVEAYDEVTDEWFRVNRFGAGGWDE